MVNLSALEVVEMMDAEGVRRFRAACEECPDKMDNAVVDMWLAVKWPVFALTLARQGTAYCALYGNEILTHHRQLDLLGERLKKLGFDTNVLSNGTLFVSILRGC